MNKNTRLPSYPLITHDPFFSIWSSADLPYTADTCHWAGASKKLRINVTIDGKSRRLMGKSLHEGFPLIGREVTPLSTIYTYEGLGVRLTLRFTSPLLPDDLDILSTPVSFLDASAESADGQPHTVKLTVVADESQVFSGEMPPRMRRDFFSDDMLHYGYIGQMRQKPLAGSGDHMTIDWGYFFLAAADGEIYSSPTQYAIAVNYRKEGTAPFTAQLMLAYDDVASLNYFGRMLPAYYARNGKTIIQALREFCSRHDEIIARCDAFDRQLLKDAGKLGGEDYRLIVSAAYRQTIAAHKLAADTNGDLLFVSKENDSNGCAATVDVSYPSVPLFLLYCPELVRAMCRPVLKFARMPIWHYDFAPHDAGRYPVMNGQIYAAYLRPQNHSEGNTIAPYYLYPSTVDAYDPKKQMPVEESANMILMLAAAAEMDGNYTFCEENMDLLSVWCRYLTTYGEDPGEQLCTDDFAGHLAHNVNLSAKAVMGIAAYARILRHLGRTAEAEEMDAKARAMGESWQKRADNGSFSSLTFDGEGWSQKYNLVWDKFFGFGILPDEFYEREVSSYLPRLNRYGLPLDSRASYTKSDWIMWSASLTDDTAKFRALAKPLARYLRETPSRVPFSDYYDTISGCYEQFIGRSVQGGVFMPLLMQKRRV